MNQNQNQSSTKPLKTYVPNQKESKPKINNISQPQTSTTKNNTVSKYFSKLSKPGAIEENPLKSCQNHNLNDSSDDFKSPTVIGKRNAEWKLNKTNLKTAKSKKTKGASKNLKNSTLEIITNNFVHCNENPEHLQMALALSKSTYEAENECNSGTLFKDEIPDIKAILQKAMPTSLERFGFKSKRAFKKENHGTILEMTKKAKNRFKYVTPILMIRTDEDRESIITSKISLILNNSGCMTKEKCSMSLMSSKLTEYFAAKLPIFNMDRIYERNNFYVESLNLTKSTTNCGYLLKDWTSIPGREKSPKTCKTSILHDSFNFNNEEIQLEQRSACRNASPDLFLSDEEFLNQSYEKSSSEILNNDANFKCGKLDLKISSGTIDLTEETSNLKKIESNFYCLDEFEEFIIEANITNEANMKLDMQIEEKDKHFNCTEILEDNLPINERYSNSSLTLKKKYCKNTQFKERLGTITTVSDNSARISRGYNSNDLNITDYINSLLNREKDNVDTKRRKCETSTELYDESDNVDSIPNSQGSEAEDEELEYSSHFVFNDFSENDYGCKDICINNGIEENDNKEINILNDTLEHCKDDFKNPSPITTPGNVIIKTNNVTPMPNYDTMRTPEVHENLDKVGVKPLKRSRGVKLLKYIYEATHPVTDTSLKSDSDDNDDKIIKKRKHDSELTKNDSNGIYITAHKNTIDIIGDALLEKERMEELIFENKQSTKIPSCRVPLQIVWHNFLCCNPAIREKVLLYEPLQLETLHILLKEMGFKFHMQDLLSFLDKKCITIRIARKTSKN
ncbi:hypothetical protein ABEB36_003657 [Hypothenemus hampei]|uniref:Structure-specific endonuclease subunit SLX4 n=1 Tax=Hypothenemus hampei TaxID=57062 RepID=A0ABD1F9V5_HYPHA